MKIGATLAAELDTKTIFPAVSTVGVGSVAKMSIDVCVSTNDEKMSTLIGAVSGGVPKLPLTGVLLTARLPRLMGGVTPPPPAPGSSALQAIKLPAVQPPVRRTYTYWNAETSEFDPCPPPPWRFARSVPPANPIVVGSSVPYRLNVSISV